MTTQAIIVYRNPAEAAFWEGGMVFPLIVGLIVGVIVAVIAATMYDKFVFRGQYTGEVAIIAAVIGVVGTMWYMM